MSRYTEKDTKREDHSHFQWVCWDILLYKPILNIVYSGSSTNSLFLLLPLSDRTHNSTASLSQPSICKPIAAAISGDVPKLPHQIQFFHTNEGSTLEIII